MKDLKQWILFSWLLGICSALPLYTYADPFAQLWIRNFLRPQPSYWIKIPQQQYEYSLPVHPPPLPSQQTPTIPQPAGRQDNPHYQLMNRNPTRQIQLQQYNFPFLQLEGNQPGLPSDRQNEQLPAIQEYLGTLDQRGPQQDLVQQPQQQPVHPNLYYMSYVANQGGAPARLGIVSSEEMQGGGFGAPAYQAMSPDVFAMNAGFGNMKPRIGQPGDYTVEDDQLGITEQPDIQGGANMGPNPPQTGNNMNPIDGQQGGTLLNANSNLQNSLAQSKGLLGAAQVTANPLATQGLPDTFLPFGADTTDPTMLPDAMATTRVAGYPQVGQDMWHFQEP